MIKFLKEWNRQRKWRRRAKKAAARRDRLRSFGERAIGVLVDTKQGLYAVDPEDDFVARKLLQEGEYSPRELQQCLALTSGDSSVLVVGTHIGAIAVPLSKKCGRMVAIEANPRTFRFLQANLLLNACANVAAFNFAANDVGGQIEFILSRDNSGGSKRRPCIDDASYWYDQPEVQRIDAFPLDEKLAGERFDLVFMDIEGSEYFALKGMQKILQEASALIVEFIPHHIEKVAGVSVADFIGVIQPHFRTMYVPSLGKQVAQDSFAECLEDMFRQRKSDEGLVFTKESLPEKFRALIASR